MVAASVGSAGLIVAQIEDVTTRRDAEGRLVHFALHDHHFRLDLEDGIFDILEGGRGGTLAIDLGAENSAELAADCFHYVMANDQSAHEAPGVPTTSAGKRSYSDPYLND